MKKIEWIKHKIGSNGYVDGELTYGILESMGRYKCRTLGDGEFTSLAKAKKAVNKFHATSLKNAK